MRQVLGGSRLRRDRLERLADALESEFLRSVLDEDLWYDRIVAVEGPVRRRTFDLEVDELHTFVADDVVVHNCAAPFRQAEFDIMYGRGISREGSVLDIATDLGIVKKSGAWYTYEGEQLGQGRENVKTFLADNPELMVQISEKIRSEVGLAEPDAQEAGPAFSEADEAPIILD
jgi:recombination protein RecA